MLAAMVMSRESALCPGWGMGAGAVTRAADSRVSTAIGMLVVALRTRAQIAFALGAFVVIDCVVHGG